LIAEHLRHPESARWLLGPQGRRSPMSRYPRNLGPGPASPIGAGVDTHRKPVSLMRADARVAAIQQCLSRARGR
jgi:hypothetical protein